MMTSEVMLEVCQRYFGGISLTIPGGGKIDIVFYAKIKNKNCFREKKVEKTITFLPIAPAWDAYLKLEHSRQSDFPSHV